MVHFSHWHVNSFHNSNIRVRSIKVWDIWCPERIFELRKPCWNFLGCNCMSSGKQVLTFRRNVLSPFSCSVNARRVTELLDPEDRGDTSLANFKDYYSPRHVILEGILINYARHLFIQNVCYFVNPVSATGLYPFFPIFRHPYWT